MIIKTVASDLAPSPVGPYSPALRVGDFLFISGQIPLTSAGELIVDDFESETRQVLDNIQALLAAEGMDFSHVVKMNIYTTDLSQFDTINRIYSEYVMAPFPARAAIEVPALPKGARIEMEGIACVK